eukprot:CAMPEP_0170572040 /NCGR_PEP_ID=MMETSP0224-20130122/2000_1 /TAXON_ID=285029 /ORGANISM="Togula jolla, Strain CCCM 725" /LENGTH=61 /DNA_ID=CAMNT_0010894495 /DNA_START=1 /DNA_END=182 /DNA_ORIENTATION=-
MHPLFTAAVFLGTLLLRRKLHLRKVQERVHGFRFLGIPWAALLQPYTIFIAAFSGMYAYVA